MLLHGGGFAGEEGLGLIYQPGIIGDADFARAGAGATLDLVEQAGPRAVFIIAVRAASEQEGALQGIERAINRPDTGEGPEILPFLLRAPRCLVICGAS